MTSEEARKRIDALSVSASSFTSDEARAANRPESIFNFLGRWLSQRRTISALEFAADAVVHAGKRVDVDLLRVDGIEPAEQAEAVISDTRFAVSQRSLV